MKVHRVAVLALLALLLLVLDAQLALTLAPALAIAALPLSGAFVGETLIVARRAAPRPPRPRPARVQWPHVRRAVPALSLGRSPRTLRGPPRLA